MMNKHPFYFGLAIGCIIVLCLKIMEERARNLLSTQTESAASGEGAGGRGEREPEPRHESSTSGAPSAQRQREESSAVPPTTADVEATHRRNPSLSGTAPALPSMRPTPAAAPAQSAVGEDPRERAREEEEANEQLIFSPDREGIRDSMSSQVGPAVLECYQGWLEENPGLEGRITIQFTIPPEGAEDDARDDVGARGDAEGVAVRDAKLLVDDVAHPFLSGCLLNSVEGLRFEAPASGEPVVVRYPFQFSR